MGLREKITELEFCQQNCNLRKADCKKPRRDCKTVFRAELKKKTSWPNVMADDILALLAPFLPPAKDVEMVTGKIAKWFCHETPEMHKFIAVDIIQGLSTLSPTLPSQELLTESELMNGFCKGCWLDKDCEKMRGTPEKCRTYVETLKERTVSAKAQLAKVMGRWK